jgi:NAD(P)-dependent dehydrogenase (short-subunit alcohol dehydrogenase family)
LKLNTEVVVGQRNAIITGGSAGLGRALSRLLVQQGWHLTVDGRRAGPLADLRAELGETDLVTVAGDIADPEHRLELVLRAAAHGPIGVIVNNASELGASPLPVLRDLDPDTLERLWRVNVGGPLGLVQAAWPRLADQAVIINISSDAAADHYEGWGGYGGTKAALDHQTLTWAAEEPQHRWYAIDPGDMRTAMHQAAFPGQDISDRPEPEAVAPAIVAVIDSWLPSGRYRAAELATTPTPDTAEVSR